MIELSDRQLRDFQDAVAWETAMELPDGRVLGVAGKRGLEREGDFRIRALDEGLQLANKRVLEFGSNEGVHTVQLARVAREVVALEVRPRNIVCTLVRLFVNDIRNVRVVLSDVRELKDDLGHFDVLFHVGVLYHLEDPVEHLFRIASHGEHLLLDTHYEQPSSNRKQSDLKRQGERYEAFLYQEPGWGAAFAGVEETSRWLTRDALFRLLGDAGFGEVELLSDREERNGSRITILAHK